MKTFAGNTEAPRISIDELKKLIEVKSDVIILDARPRRPMSWGISKAPYRSHGKQK